jgi:hypothetical protein
MSLNKKTSVLPLFPLKIFLLPGEKRMLHIFEQKYRNMFTDIQDSDNLFGIPYYVNGETKDIGSVVRRESVQRNYPSGEFDVIIKGESLFNTISFHIEHSTELYPFGEVEILLLNNFKLNKNVIKEFEIFCVNILKIEPEVNKINSLLGVSTVLGLLDWEKFDLISDFDESKINTKLLNIIKLKTEINNLNDNLSEGFSLN